MLRPLLITLAALLACSGSAQLWCPAGATWNFSLVLLAGEGNIIRTYEGDTIIEGWNAQKIRERGWSFSYWGPPDTNELDAVQFTSVQDSILFLRTHFSGVPTWDTLLRFDAVIGDRWFPAGQDSMCMNGIEGMLEVLDTGTVLIGTMLLRTWTLSYINAFGDPIWGSWQVTERLGHPYGLSILPGSCIIVEYGETLNCYQDSAISYNISWPYDCGSGVGIEEEQAAYVISVHPTPGHDRFMLELPPGRHMLLVTDLAGRAVHTSPVEAGMPVDASRWPAGTYVLRLPELGRSLRWVKE
ncbi:MAG: hypothetical protein R2810_14920 [Flavobacteriales bacterium]